MYKIMQDISLGYFMYCISLLGLRFVHTGKSSDCLYVSALTLHIVQSFNRNET